MVQAIQGKHVPELRLFARTLESWIETTTRIAKAWQPDDIPWWYNERALLSIFAGAVWLAGGIAFEEFRTEKRVPGKRTRALHPGRQDLYIQIRKNGFLAESKILWSAASAPNAQPSVTIDKALDQACKEVRRTPSYGERRLGIVFARPYVRWKHQESIDSHIERWLEKARQVGYACCAWVFPAESRVFGNELHILPGMAVFIREV
jgi:hypothetical protein